MIIEEFLAKIIPYIGAILELIGVGIIVLGTVRALSSLIKSRFDFGDENLKIEFAKALAMSLEFKLASEILKSVIIKTLDEILILFSIVVLRVVITFVLHWEIKSSEEIGKIETKRD